MNGMLPDELYKIIIKESIFERYPSLRLVCQKWWEIVENSEFKEVLRCIRILRSRPNFIKELPMGDINFQDGSVHYNTRVYGYNDNNLIDIRQHADYEDRPFPYNQDIGAIIKMGEPLQVIINKYGTFKLSTSNYRVDLEINGEKTDLLAHIKQPYIIRCDTEFHIMNGNVYKYDGHWKTIRNLSKYEHIRCHFIYRRDNNSIRILTYDELYIGLIHLPTSHFGMGPDYFAIYTNKLEIYHI